MALEGKQPPGRVPHFELVFYLTMEAFGRIHPQQRYYYQWDQMSRTERDLHIRDMADLHIQTARKYEHSAIFFHDPPFFDHDDDILRILDSIREQSGMDYYLTMHGGATFGVPSGEEMVEFSVKLAEHPQQLKDEAERMVDKQLARVGKFHKHGVLDGYTLCTDYCMNNGPFLSPAMFDEFVMPYLTRLIAAYREMGFYTMLHTDGNIMPILDRLVAAGPHALQSLDPQGGVDIAEVKRLVGKKVCLMGNVSCAMLQTGTDEQVIEAARYALKHGMPGGGYIFSTSNCIYTGMPLRRYELMLDVWRKEGNYK